MLLPHIYLGFLGQKADLHQMTCRQRSGRFKISRNVFLAVSHWKPHQQYYYLEINSLTSLENWDCCWHENTPEQKEGKESAWLFHPWYPVQWAVTVAGGVLGGIHQNNLIWSYLFLFSYPGYSKIANLQLMNRITPCCVLTNCEQFGICSHARKYAHKHKIHFPQVWRGYFHYVLKHFVF